jgi:hypothetical protein
MSKPTRAETDWSAHAGAQVLARRIALYWRQRGYAGIVTWVVGMHDANGELTGTYGVRSNCVDGIPPREPIQAAGEAPCAS